MMTALQLTVMFTQKAHGFRGFEEKVLLEPSITLCIQISTLII